MVEFNADGSIKVTGRLAENQARREERLKKERCVLIKKELVEFSPKKCILHITVSDAIADTSFVEKIFMFFQERSETPAKLNKTNEKQFDIEIGTDFKRCSDCNNLMSRFRDFLDGNLLEDKGSCTLKERNFSYEDYF